MSIAGQMIGGFVKGTAGKVIGGVIAAIVVVAMIAAGVSDGPGAAAGALIVSIFVLFGLAFIVAVPTFIVVLIIATQRARRLEVGAMQGYASQRGLAFAPTGTLPATTPLLTAGSRRETQDVMTGPLPGGIQGTLAHYTFYVRRQSNDNRTRYVPYPQTVVLTQLPESAIFVKHLTVHGEGPLKTLTLFGADFSNDVDVVEFESTALGKRFQIKTSEEQDKTWLRELFSPTFIDWLATKTPKEFSFELVDGLLVVSVGERYNRPDQLDWFCGVAAYVRNRIHSEVREDAPPPPVPTQPPAVPPIRRRCHDQGTHPKEARWSRARRALTAPRRGPRPRASERDASGRPRWPSVRWTASWTRPSATRAATSTTRPTSRSAQGRPAMPR